MIHKVLRGVGILALAGMVALLLAGSVVPRLMGAVPLTVLTGSMAPALNPGDLAVVSPVTNPASIAIGEIVSFRPESGSELLVTHRVVGVTKLGNGKVQLTTRGDANQDADTPIEGEQAVGRMVYRVPLAGHVGTIIPGEARGLVAQGVGILLIGSGAFSAIRNHSVFGRKRRRA